MRRNRGAIPGPHQVALGVLMSQANNPMEYNMLRLFAVRLPDGSLLPRYFEDKPTAKRERDKHPGAVVVLGPDHHRY